VGDSGPRRLARALLPVGQPLHAPDAADFRAVVPYKQEVARNEARLPRRSRCGCAAASPAWPTWAARSGTSTCATPRRRPTPPARGGRGAAHLDGGGHSARPRRSPDHQDRLARASAGPGKRELARKPDFIKVWFIHQKGDDLAAQEAIVRASADEAHAAA
jgi:hypothetical protein